jgi:hypothetical protein
MGQSGDKAPHSKELKTSRTTHGAVIAGLATRFDAASLFVLKVIDQLRNCSFFNAKSLLTRMRNRGIYSG